MKPQRHTCPEQFNTGVGFSVKRAGDNIAPPPGFLRRGLCIGAEAPHHAFAYFLVRPRAWPAMMLSSLASILSSRANTADRSCLNVSSHPPARKAIPNPAANNRCCKQHRNITPRQIETRLVRDHFAGEAEGDVATIRDWLHVTSSSRRAHARLFRSCADVPWLSPLQYNGSANRGSPSQKPPVRGPHGLRRFWTEIR